MISRTLLKTGTYGVMHFAVAILVAFALTRNWHIALAVGVVEPLVQTLAFALHERLWAARDPTAAVARASCGHGRLWSSRATAEHSVRR